MPEAKESKHPLINRLTKLFEFVEGFTNEQEINLCIAEVVHEHQEGNDLNTGWRWQLVYDNESYAWKTPAAEAPKRPTDCKTCRGEGRVISVIESLFTTAGFEECPDCKGSGHEIK